MPISVAGVVKMITTTLMMMIIMMMTKATNDQTFHKDNTDSARVTKQWATYLQSLLQWKGSITYY